MGTGLSSYIVAIAQPIDEDLVSTWLLVRVRFKLNFKQCDWKWKALVRDCRKTCFPFSACRLLYRILRVPSLLPKQIKIMERNARRGKPIMCDHNGWEISIWWWNFYSIDWSGSFLHRQWQPNCETTWLRAECSFVRRRKNCRLTNITQIPISLDSSNEVSDFPDDSRGINFSSSEFAFCHLQFA